MATLAQHLAETSLHVKRIGVKLLCYVQRRTELRYEPEEYTTLCESATWLAFVGLGGDPDAPDTFDWGGKVMRKEALRQLRGLLMGKGSEFSDIALRNADRPNRANVDAYAWTAWQHYSGLEGVDSLSGAQRSSRSPHGSARFLLRDYGTRNETEEALQDEALLALVRELAGILKPDEFYWLVTRYRDGVPQEEHIRELVARDAALPAAEQRYQGPTGWKRAENFVNVTVHRARKKAAAKLGARWRVHLEEVA